MELVDALRTTGSSRRFSAEPVGDDLVTSILDDARFAPSGGNRQPWRVAVVKNSAIRRTLADLMTTVWQQYVGESQNPSRAPFALGRSTGATPVATPNPLLDDIEQVPVVLAIAANLRKIALMDGTLDRPAMTGGASIYPFCWSVLLAARARGLGGVLTTFLSRAEPAAAPILGLPADHALVATIFLGHPTRPATKLTRNPVDGFATIDRFDGRPLS